MRAVGVNETGGPERLQILDVPEPEPGPGEVRIAVHAATVNPTDMALREGYYGTGSPPPYIPGMDAAGLVDVVGEGVSLEPGEPVVAIVNPLTPRGGAYAEKIIVPAGSVTPIPDGMDLIEAATIPLNALTARRGLQVVNPQRSGAVAVTGGAGGVGAFAIELAKHAGLRVVADAKDEDVELVRSFGADVVLPRGEEFSAAVSESEGGGVGALVDAAAMGPAALPAVRDGGAMAAMRPFQAESDRGIEVHWVSPADYVDDGEGLAELVDLADRGVLTLRVAQTFPAEEAAEAHRRFEAGGVRGRLVLTFAQRRDRHA